MRLFRLIATPMILLGLLGFLVWGGLWGWRNLTAPLPEPEPTPCVPVEQEVLVPGDVVVNVYNGGYTRGLAERAAEELRKRGFVVNKVSNTEETISTTIIRGAQESRPGMVLATYSFLGVTFDYDDRVDGTIDVLVGAEFEGYRPSIPAEQVDLEGQPWCKPDSLANPSASPSPSAAESPAPEASETGEG